MQLKNEILKKLNCTGDAKQCGDYIGADQQLYAAIDRANKLDREN